VSRPEIVCHIKTIQDEIKPKSHVKSEHKSRDHYDGKSGKTKVGGN
jgi:hypothetical protein